MEKGLELFDAEKGFTITTNPDSRSTSLQVSFRHNPLDRLSPADRTAPEEKTSKTPLGFCWVRIDFATRETGITNHKLEPRMMKKVQKGGISNGYVA